MDKGLGGGRATGLENPSQNAFPGKSQSTWQQSDVEDANENFCFQLIGQKEMDTNSVFIIILKPC